MGTCLIANEIGSFRQRILLRWLDRKESGTDAVAVHLRQCREWLEVRRCRRQPRRIQFLDGKEDGCIRICLRFRTASGKRPASAKQPMAIPLPREGRESCSVGWQDRTRGGFPRQKP